MKLVNTRSQQEITPTEETASLWPRLRALLRSGVRILFAAYVTLCLLLFFLQGYLIFPGRQTQGRPSSRVQPPPGTELLPLTTQRGNRIVALYGPALQADGESSSASARCITILYFYGNGMCLHDCFGQFAALRRLGVNVLIPEYVGYGMSDGSPSETDCYATANAAYDYLLTRKDIDPHRIAAVGWSLGGAVAIDLASRRPVIGLATFSAFSSLREEAHRQFPFFPTSLLLVHPFLSDTRMSRIACPILLGHGTADSIVPFTMMGRLKAAAGRPVTCLPVAGAGHNDIFTVGGKRLLQSLGVFLKKAAPPIAKTGS